MTLSPERQEQLEMSGYSWGRNGSTSRYHYHGWTEEEAAAFNKGYDEGIEFSIAIGERRREVTA